MTDQFNKILGQRLREVRERLGLTLEEVADRIGFNNYQVLSSIENGSRQIKASELAKLAKIYLRDISYFLSSDQKVEIPTLVLWRNYSEEKGAKIKEQEFLRFCQNYYDLEERLGLDHRFTLPQVNNLTPDDFTYEKIRDIATEYYNEMLLGSRPACVLEKVLEEKYNIKILYLDLENYGSAASVIGNFGAAILTNSSEPNWRKNYNIAHELFHIITWRIFDYKNIHINRDEKSIIERWADAFASNLLLPQDEVTREFENKIKDEKISLLDLIGIAREFVVSTEALLWRLVTLKLLPESIVSELRSSDKLKELDKIQRAKDIRAYPHISIRYINLAFKAFQKGLISKGKLADYLDVDRSEVARVLESYGYKEEAVYDEEFAVA